MRHLQDLVGSALLLGLAGSAVAESDYVQRDYVVDVALVSHVSGGSIEDYGWHGSGMTASGSRLGLGVRIDGERLMVEFAPYAEQNRLMLSVDVEPKSDDRRFEPFDLTTLRPLAIGLGTDASGRVYQANVTPRVRITDRTPQQLDVERLRMHYWSFPNCTILLNDAHYVGRVSGGRSPIGFLDICGTARVEFSLLRSKAGSRRVFLALERCR